MIDKSIIQATSSWPFVEARKLVKERQKIYEKKGHEFIDVIVNLFDENDESCVMTINLIAIYKLRGS